MEQTFSIMAAILHISKTVAKFSLSFFFIFFLFGFEWNELFANAPEMFKKKKSEKMQNGNMANVPFCCSSGANQQQSTALWTMDNISKDAWLIKIYEWFTSCVQIVGPIPLKEWKTLLWYFVEPSSNTKLNGEHNSRLLALTKRCTNGIVLLAQSQLQWYFMWVRAWM